MPQTPNPAEVRTLQALRQTNVISKTTFDQCIALLEATEQCKRCLGTGLEPESPIPDTMCTRCAGSGEQWVIR